MQKFAPTCLANIGRERQLWSGYLTSFICFYSLNHACSAFVSVQFLYKTLVLCESQFLPPSDSAWAHVSIEYTGAYAHARMRPGLGSQSLLRGAYRQIYTPIIGTWDSGQQLRGSCSYNRVTERGASSHHAYH